jgi:hypothetical protein
MREFVAERPEPATCWVAAGPGDQPRRLLPMGSVLKGRGRRMC